MIRTLKSLIYPCFVAWFCLVALWFIGLRLMRFPEFLRFWAYANAPLMWLASAVAFVWVGRRASRPYADRPTAYGMVIATIAAVCIVTSWYDFFGPPDDEIEDMRDVVILYYFIPSAMAANFGFLKGQKLAGRGNTR